MSKQYSSDEQYRRCYDEDLPNILIEITQELIDKGRDRHWASFEARPISLALQKVFPYANLFARDEGIYAPTEDWRVLIFHVGEHLKWWIRQYNKYERDLENKGPKVAFKPVDIEPITLWFRPYSPDPEELQRKYTTLGIKNKDYYYSYDYDEEEEDEREYGYM